MSDPTTALVITAPDLVLGVADVRETGGPDAELSATMTLDGRHAGPDGRTSVGSLGVLVDNVLGYSLIVSLPAGSWTVSTEIWIDIVAPLPEHGAVRAVARTLQVGSYAVGTVTDEDGRALAHCRERGRLLAAGLDLRGYRSPVHAPPPRDGLAATLGMRLGTSPGEVSQLQVVPPLENPNGVLHGGVSLAAAELVATASRRAAGSDLATSSLHCVHTRAAPAGAQVELRATTVHAGRSLWITDVTGTVAGKPVVVARVSAQ